MSEDVVADDDKSASSFDQRTDELFNKLSTEDSVSSEPVGLVAALTDLDLQVTEEDVVEATRGILPTTENQFSKEDFFRFVEALRPQHPIMDGDKKSASDVSENFEQLSPTPGCAGGSDGPTAMTETPLSGSGWVFHPRLSVDKLAGDARLVAEQVYAKVKENMMADIDRYVDAEREKFVSQMPTSYLSETMQLGLEELVVAALCEACRCSSRALYKGEMVVPAGVNSRPVVRRRAS